MFETNLSADNACKFGGNKSEQSIPSLQVSWQIERI